MNSGIGFGIGFYSVDLAMTLWEPIPLRVPTVLSRVFIVFGMLLEVIGFA